VRYLRIYADAAGESHFETFEPRLTSRDLVPPAPPVEVSDAWSAATVVFVHIPSGWVDVPHCAPGRQLCTVLAGELDLITSDGEVQSVRAGDVVLVEDTTGKGHHGRVTSPGNVLLQFVALST
jgi:quercetin dioxygenase-like cupin family protein